MQNNPTAFVSYSWDSTEHQQWVHDFVNNLRVNGVDASFDLFEIQNGTANLNTMMIKALRENDYVIFILTEKYAAKADSLQGGVGFETQLSLPILRENPDKLIFVMKHNGSYKAVFPFHLQDFYAIDFSNEREYDVKFEELLRRIFKQGKYHKEPLGPIPTFNQPTSKQPVPTISHIPDVTIPKLKRITDIDKLTFLRKSFEEMNRLFNQLFHKVETENENFQYTCDQIGATKYIYHLFVDGNKVTSMKIWMGSSFGRSENICFAFGRMVDAYQDNTMNEMVSTEVTRDNELALKMSMNIFGDTNATDAASIVKVIWARNIVPYLQ